MIQIFVLACALFACLAIAGNYPPDKVDDLVAASLPKIKEYLARNPQGNCTLETAIRRKEWQVGHPDTTFECCLLTKTAGAI